MTEQTAPDGEGKSSFQLTRELELLISGALVFALLQLPEKLDHWWSGTNVHLDGAAFALMFSAFYVAKLASYALVATTLLHFLLRGLWVAIMGLRSAYPAGPDLSRLGRGPFVTRFYETRLLSLEQLETRIDRVAAVVFAFAFTVLIMLAGLSFWAAIAGLAGFLLKQLTGNDRSLWIAAAVVVGAFALALGAVMSLDGISKKRALSPASERRGERVMRAIYYGTGNFLYAPIFLTFSTRISKRVFIVLQLGFVYSLIAVFAFSAFSSAGMLGFDIYLWFPAKAGAAQLRASHYEDIRRPESRSVLPTIQAGLISETYVRLFVPYDARHDNARIRALCPGVAPFRSNGLFLQPRTKPRQERIDAVNRCFDLIHKVTLDGAALTLADSFFYVHPENGLHGRLAMIPAATLAPGRHQLVVSKAAIPGKKGSGIDYSIPFWR